MKQYAVYIRVSTRKQGASGLGLEAQRKICDDFIKSQEGEKVAEFQDVESGTHRDRKGLAQAVAFCKKNDCCLVIAKLDRLARDVEFCFKIVNTGVDIHFCDMPNVSTLLLGVFASVAQYERELTSDRTKQALAAKKARGEKLGGASSKWVEAYKNKTKTQKEQEYMKRGKMKNERYLQSREVQVFFKVLKNVFGDVLGSDDPFTWDWSKVTTRGEYKERIISLMKDYKEMDETGTVFKRWDLDSEDKEKLRARICAFIQNLRNAIKTNERLRNV